MSVRNEWHGIGNLTADPEGRSISTKDGDVRVLNATIAVNGLKRKGQDRNDVVFVDLEFWGKGAQIIEEHGSKGDKVAVTGEYKVDKWDDKTTGTTRYRSKFRVIDHEFLKCRKWATDGAAAGPAAPAEDEGDERAAAAPEQPEPEKPTRAKAGTRSARRPEPEPEEEGDDDIPF